METEQPIPVRYSVCGACWICNCICGWLGLKPNDRQIPEENNILDEDEEEGNEIEVLPVERTEEEEGLGGILRIVGNEESTGIPTVLENQVVNYNHNQYIVNTESDSSMSSGFLEELEEEEINSAILESMGRKYSERTLGIRFFPSGSGNENIRESNNNNNIQSTTDSSSINNRNENDVEIVSISPIDVQTVQTLQESDLLSLNLQNNENNEEKTDSNENNPEIPLSKNSRLSVNNHSRLSVDNNNDDFENPYKPDDDDDDEDIVFVDDEDEEDLISSPVIIDMISKNEQTELLGIIQESMEKEDLKESKQNLELAMREMEKKQKKDEEEKRKMESKLEDFECKICLDERVSVALVPCGHVACATCEKKLHRCPFCKQEITLRLKLYYI